VSERKEKFFWVIPLVSGLFVERRWKIAYSTGKSGRHGEKVGGMGRTWAYVGGTGGFGSAGRSLLGL